MKTSAHTNARFQYSPKPKDNPINHPSQCCNVPSLPTIYADNIRVPCDGTAYLAPGKLNPNPGTAGGVATATGSGLTTCW